MQLTGRRRCYLSYRRIELILAPAVHHILHTQVRLDVSGDIYSVLYTIPKGHTRAVVAAQI